MSTSRLRFAALVRVSTEQQERQGESLRTQRKSNESDVERLGGRIVGLYGGQEHGTPGHERKELDRLLADAAKGKFDAVMVANADRWSRDNGRSRDGLEIFRSHGIRFFVGATEYDLFNPEHCLFLGMAAVFGEFQARHQSRKSILNRIERARRGLPACGKLPFGRTFDARAGWGIDTEKRAMIEDVARRYLAGEPLPKLAKEYGVNHSNLHKVLTRRCGEEWEQEFAAPALNIHEKVVTKVPRLLPEETIVAVRRRVEGNKTYTHGQTKNRYLLGRTVFCSHCGYTMFGQTNRNGHRYYRHAHSERQRPCPCPKSWINADELEAAVFRDLFDLFGNPLAVQKAVEAATPDRGKIDELRERLDRLDRDLAKVRASKDRIVGAIAKGVIGDDEAAKQLTGLRERETSITDERATITTTLDRLPSQAEIKETAKRVSAAFLKLPDMRLTATIDELNGSPEMMGWEERRQLVQLVFDGKATDGRRMGVYIEFDGERSRRRQHWVFRAIGRVVDQWGPLCPPDADPLGGTHQKELLQSVTSSALY